MPTRVVNSTLIETADELLDVGAHLLQDAERLAAALVLEDAIRQVERVAHAVGVELRAQPLRDDVDEVVLKVLGHARDERHADRGQQQQAHAAEELAVVYSRYRVAYSSMT